MSVLSELRFDGDHLFDHFMRKTVHRLFPACCRVDLAPCCSKCFTSSTLYQSVVACVIQEAYSANPIPPCEQPVTRTTLDIVMRRAVRAEKFRYGQSWTKAGFNASEMNCLFGPVGVNVDLGGLVCGNRGSNQGRCV